MTTQLTCYNRGCGQSFDPQNNPDDGCLHHPGVPFFHDAYKGWSCCQRKSVDFTEFLNFKGCTRSKHSNVKPPEPEKKQQDVEKDVPVKVVANMPAPIQSSVHRPPFDTKMQQLEPWVAPAFRKQIDDLLPTITQKANAGSGAKPMAIQEGTGCKHGGCNATYEGSASDEKPCVYHPGVPIFHEGLKFWSCCKNRTIDFTAFMNQVGCEHGKHQWVSEDDSSKVVKCRLDWHQTATNVVVSIYAKNYHYAKSTVHLNPIRLVVRLVFPQQAGNEYSVDMELRGIVDVEKSKVQMYGTKVEITLMKAEPGSWAKLDFPRDIKPSAEDAKKLKTENSKNDPCDDDDSDSDDNLDGIEPALHTATITELKD